MNENLRLWLDSEMRGYEPAFKAFNRKLNRQLPIWMLVSVAALVALGFGVGYEWQYVVRVHLPIGLGIAAFIWLCYFIRGRSVSMKKVRKQYEKALSALSPSDQDALALQGSQCGHLDFLNTNADNCPARLTVGPDYWVYYRGACHTYRVADIERLWAVQETARVNYSLGNKRVNQNLGVGVSLMVGYRDGTQSAAKYPEDKIYLETGKQLEQAKELMDKYCPKSRTLWNKEEK